MALMMKHKIQMLTGLVIEYTVTKDCRQTSVIGSICTQCNECGRFDYRDKAFEILKDRENEIHEMDGRRKEVVGKKLQKEINETMF